MTTQTQETKKVKKQKRGLTLVGKFFAKVRIDLDLPADQWAKTLGVSASYVNNVERGEKEFDLEFARKVEKLLPKQHKAEFASMVAEVLGVLIIPAQAQPHEVSMAYNILTNGYYESNEDGTVTQVTE